MTHKLLTWVIASCRDSCTLRRSSRRTLWYLLSTSSGSEGWAWHVSCR